MIAQDGRVIRKIISINLDIISYKDAVIKIIDWARIRKSSYICFANVHMTIEAYHHYDFAAQVNQASLVLADGMPLVKSLKSFYGCLQDRVAGMDILPDLLREAEVNQLKVFFFGTTPELLVQIRTKVNIEFPNLQIAGLLSPPFDRSLDDDSYINQINESGAHMVFVALGCPKQEKWMANHSHQIKAPLLGVGGAFPVFAGVAKRAPLFMQKFGMEWLYRLFQEPDRLFKRYFTTNSLFIYLVTKMKLKQILNQ